MENNNTSRIDSFFIIGFPGLSTQYYALVSLLLLLLFLAIAVGNIFILVFVYCERSLHKPTYLIFCHLAFSDLAFGTTTLPRIIAKYWFDDSVTGFNACFVQMFFVHFTSAAHSFILMMMGLDRFIAICSPMRYSSFTNNVASILCGLSWFLSASWMVFIVINAYSLSYCNSNIIAQCNCDHYSITRLSCDDKQLIQVIALAGAMVFLLVPLAFLIFSYFFIFFVALKLSSQEGCRRTLSTCTPQLLITLLYYTPRCFMYLARYVGFTFTPSIHVLIIMLYSLLPAAINPMIYCFKTKDIKECLSKRYKMAKIHVGLSK